MEKDAIVVSDMEAAGIELEGDVSQETMAHYEITKVKDSTIKKKPKAVGPPRPDHRDGMGGYKVPPGGKPLTVNDIPGPGPTSYNPEYTPVMKTYPGWSFGEREGEKSKKKCPGPNKYNTSGDLKWGKCKTITLKSRVPERYSNAKYPGPGEYSIPRSISSGPQYSIRLKPNSELLPGLVSKLALHPDPETPGPDYNVSPDEWLKKPRSFGIKTKELKKSVGPGPQKYCCRYSPTGPKWIMGELKEQSRLRHPNPGPQKYSLKSTIGEAPKYTFGNRFQPLQSKFITPGPDVYNSAGIRLDEPGFTMKYRWFDSPPEKRPGPYSYSDEQIRKRPPAFTMSTRGKLSYPSSVYSNMREDGPAPNQYNVPRDQLRQGKTVSIRLKDTEHREVPGPADYQNIDHINANQRRAPAYSLANKFTQKFEEGPGPGAYDIKCLDTKPGKTFGVKSEKKAPTCGPNTMLYPVDINKVCGSSDFVPGATLKSRHTPHKYLGFKDSSLIPLPSKDAPIAPLFG